MRGRQLRCGPARSDRRAAWNRLEQRVLGVGEDRVHVTVTVAAARRRAEDALPAPSVALERLDDLEHGDGVGGPAESVAAASSAGRVDQAGARQVGHDLRQEAHRDGHRLGDARGAQGRIRRGAGDGDHGADAVVGAAGQLETHRAA